MSNTCRITLCTLLVFAFCGFTLQAQNQEFGQTRIGIRNHIYQAPLEVVGLKFEDKKIAAGQDLLTSRDWIKRLTVTVKNASDRNLIGVGARVEFPYDDKDMHTLPEIEFHAGHDPVIGFGRTDFVLRPGETAELSLSEGWLKAVDTVIEMAGKLNRPQLVHRVIVLPNWAAFSQDEVWRGGTYKRRAGDKWAVDKQAMNQVI